MPWRHVWQVEESNVTFSWKTLASFPQPFMCPIIVPLLAFEILRSLQNPRVHHRLFRLFFVTLPFVCVGPFSILLLRRLNEIRCVHHRSMRLAFLPRYFTPRSQRPSVSWRRIGAAAAKSELPVARWGACSAAYPLPLHSTGKWFASGGY